MGRNTSPGTDQIDLRDITDRVDTLRDDRQTFLDAQIINTACIHCGQDIEGTRGDDEWRDRGSNGTCPTPEGHAGPDHEPMGDSAEDHTAWSAEYPDEAGELAELESLLDELRGAGGGDHQWDGDWYPSGLIAEHAFEEYARELAEDIGAFAPDAAWPACHIDWEAASDALKTDYSMVEYGGTTYYWR